ncbi:G2/mitotic-specific cyclin-B3 isoform X1 [Takifugu flavidus]|uniref:G2/mitotic-specific cyclin-B3 isoform X1 n=1 Tax=Takifugu flavidus TaxID=433684 RepID=UPI0025447C16|nr:G2/mitotic-specific cyclin-B3 isoform X1 [Takifugu flavidus]XP_056884093.1 G2/mitotic-specific cyclin-B3 isoform X1 [Takifugu flavidus]
MPVTRPKKTTAAAGSKIPKPAKVGSENQEEGPQVKRSSSPPHGAPKKRTAFIDITNAVGPSLTDAGVVLGTESREAETLWRRPRAQAHKVQISIPGRKKEAVKKPVKKIGAASVPTKNRDNLKKSLPVTSDRPKAERETVDKEEERAASAPGEEPATSAPPAVREVPAHLRKPDIPPEFDIDSENCDDCYLCPEYAKEIFDYLKQREEKFVLADYMHMQPSLNAEMRAILVDWLVEVQENFELFHETLYLAVKMTDHYLSKTPVDREMLQLVGSTAMLIASKFEERSPPCMEDFLYICDDAYRREELISTEASMLQTLVFDINIPIPYRFLRRYAKCVKAGMDTLTLARYYCEMSLMDMELVPERGSLLASACLLMALLTKDLGGWTPILQFHSGYQKSDLAPVIRKLHAALSAPPDDKLKAIRNKYSHKVFFEVATLPLVDLEVLEEALSH